MPTPAEIIDVISQRFSFPRKTIAQQDRLLVIHGQRKISGRGRSAMASPSDAAALLIAVAATPITGPAINIANYQSYAKLNAVHLPPGRLGTWQSIESLRDLSVGHSLLEALSRIIECLSRGTLLADGNGVTPSHDKYPYHIDVRVDLYAPVSRASVTIERTTENSFKPDLAETLHYYRVADEEPTTRPDIHIDFDQQRSFGIRTLWSLAELFNVGAQPK